MLTNSEKKKTVAEAKTLREVRRQSETAQAQQLSDVQAHSNQQVPNTAAPKPTPAFVF